MYTLGIIVASDKGAAGLREDLGGPLIKSIMSDAGYDVAEIKLISDDKETLIKTIREFADVKKYSLILTTGGTGFSPRDNTPEATLAIIERETPGISEAMRFFSLQKTPRAMLSRGVSGIRKSSLIINLPGSPKAIEECLEFLLPPLSHGLDMLNQNDSECARK
jgi:molybdopterin adenylyltransferase